ncbi:MAG: O-antigen ligase family protein [candidate division Zixibacteria bacterium]|nr:O-antigen ligase family protein [candidate division Zixibacteria bacterium]
MKLSTNNIYPDYIIQIGLIVFVILSPFSIAGAQIGLGIGLLGWLIKIIYNRKLNWASSYLEKPFLIYLLALFISALFAYNRFSSLKAIGDEWSVLIFFLMVNNLKDLKLIRKLLFIIISISGLVAIYAIWQHYTGIDLYRGKMLDFIAEAGKYRSAGNFSLSLAYGFYAMLIGILSFCLAVYEESKWKKYLFYFVSILCTTANLFTYSRSTLVAQIAIVFLFFVLNWNKKKLLLPVLAYFVLIYAIDPHILLRSQQAMRAQTLEQADIRTTIWTTSFKIFLHHPLTGVGFNNFGGFYEKYKPEGSPTFGHAHNDFLNVAANAGIIGLVAFSWLMLSILRNLIRNFKRAKEKFSLGISNAVLISFVAYLVACQFQCYYIDAVDELILFFVLGLGQTVDNYQRKVEA